MADDDVDFSKLFHGDDDDDDMFYIDMNTVQKVLDEDDDCDFLEKIPDDSSSKNVSPSESGTHDSFQIQNGSQVLEEQQFSRLGFADSVTSCSPFCSDGSDSGVRGSVGVSDSVENSWLDIEPENEGPQSQACSSPNAFPGNLSNSLSPGESDEVFCTERTRVSKHEVPACSVESSFPEAQSKDISICRDNLNPSLWKGENEIQFKHFREDVEFENTSISSIVDNDDINIEGYVEDTTGGVSGQQENDSCTSFEAFMDADRFLHVATSPDSTIGQGSHGSSDFIDYHGSSTYYEGMHSGPFVADTSLGIFPNGFCSQLPNDEMMNNMKAKSVELNSDITSYDSYVPYGDHYQDAKFNVGQSVRQTPDIFSSIGSQAYQFYENEDNYAVMSGISNQYQDSNGRIASFQENVDNLNLQAANISWPHAQALITSEKQFGCVKREGGVQHKLADSHLSKGKFENFHVEEDPDVCIIEDISHPAPTSRSTISGNSSNISQSSRYAESQSYMVGSTRLKACDERNILRVALQDLSQPRSEVSLPEGLLAVPLLRHQRIALSWMVQKEASSFNCSGGILADDQGLGKTVSTIALILKERPPLPNGGTNAHKSELDSLNLDVDDDVLPQNGRVKEESNICEDESSRHPIKSMNLQNQAKGRPSAGTLIVCPTSVLRQWAEELRSKVTSQTKISVLVYHGSNRTKDPYEVAKYDVVLTTYSIVSMEVPKQPSADKDDEEKGNVEDHAVPSRKRKSPSNSSKNGKKRSDGTVLETNARPLAKVAWFRVVLDEAQSIKNHKTQVARACWGLRAKRRWCLSGTPIQNAIDDLYSYFRFLRYDPYDVYTSFCSKIKNRISRDPANGYRKLQAVLKTIMLRRTKGTLLDGEPIISLPPKYIELKKVDFSTEERDFYYKLEADSRAQFQEYADAGTVKQNYVNILLMLLRLRQACDHPLLVKRYNSNSLWRYSVEMAKTLPQEKQISLLQCLEASLALCSICKDPPEDAFVSVCGHVFCNQCICEHLTGDDNQCPAANCKVRLSTSRVFSKVTLNNCLSDQGCDNSPGCPASEVEEFEPWSQSQSYESSKIKAALEVLKSLRKPQFYTSKSTSENSTLREDNDCPGNSSDAENGKSSINSHECQNLSDENRYHSDSVTVVGEKAIVFSQWTRMLDLLEECLKKSSINYRRLDGTMSVVARDKAVKDFNTLPEVSVIIMSLKAASLGLNLVVACHVLMLDLWWNPTTEDQAIDRAHRIGQTRPVTVLRLTVKDTVEDRILALQQKKRTMVASAFGEDGTGDRQSRLTVDDLKYLFMM
ncbi:helicase-like transcription factor CHR28 isoform X2 [Vigna radiata var. radiata]|uniref:Helicase-like transcription factor CHR28 isoform X2 n=1 Tax=Vigna radiata var. radiata TaxID=3916 RepID=A0A3Q0F5U8_VIGRR|nr:helicase-like transcription factor CHR28 isoform X2 [Vigna radiata var. radiata]